MNPQNSQEALAQLQSAKAGQKSASDILKEQQNQFGVQQAGDTVSGLRGAIASTTKLLNQVAPSVMGRTASSLVTNAQANRQIANEQQPISQQLSQYGQDYGNALSDYDRASQQANQSAGTLLTDQQNQTSFLQNLYNTLFQRESAAEEKRRFDEELALRREAEKRAAAASSGIGSYFDNNANADNNQPSNAEREEAIRKEARKQSFGGYLKDQAKQASETQKKTQAWSNSLQNVTKFDPMSIIRSNPLGLGLESALKSLFR